MPLSDPVARRSGWQLNPSVLVEYKPSTTATDTQCQGKGKDGKGKDRSKWAAHEADLETELAALGLRIKDITGDGAFRFGIWVWSFGLVWLVAAGDAHDMRGVGAV